MTELGLLLFGGASFLLGALVTHVAYSRGKPEDRVTL